MKTEEQMDPASQGPAPTIAEQCENWGNGSHLQIAATTDTSRGHPNYGDPLEGQSVSPNVRQVSNSSRQRRIGCGSNKTEPRIWWWFDERSVALCCPPCICVWNGHDKFLKIKKNGKRPSEMGIKELAFKRVLLVVVFRILKSRFMLPRRPRPALLKWERQQPATQGMETSPPGDLKSLERHSTTNLTRGDTIVSQILIKISLWGDFRLWRRQLQFQADQRDGFLVIAHDSSPTLLSRENFDLLLLTNRRSNVQMVSAIQFTMNWNFLTDLDFFLLKNITWYIFGLSRITSGINFSFRIFIFPKWSLFHYKQMDKNQRGVLSLNCQTWGCCWALRAI